MEAAKIFISLPFRVDGLEAAHPGCLKTFDSRHMNRFITALNRELCALSEESEDLLIREIEIGNGSASHLTADDLAGIIRLIKKQFHVDPQRTVRFHMTPSGFDFYKLSAVRQIRNASICFELPDLTDEGLLAAGYRCTGKQAVGALDTCFQNAFHAFGVLLTSDNMPQEKAVTLLKCILPTHPGAIFLPAGSSQQLLDAVDHVLAGEKWMRSGRSWYRDNIPPASRCTVQIGCGPGAVSVFDGVPVQSTVDFDFYCDHSDDFEALVTHVQD
ncbi:MAG: hypothetical protein IJV40_09215 [Oscillospiraceae bacterium]|nr:hypothetical protein [Oscillospiraceae bacterium]